MKIPTIFWLFLGAKLVSRLVSRNLLFNTSPFFSSSVGSRLGSVLATNILMTSYRNCYQAIFWPLFQLYDLIFSNFSTRFAMGFISEYYKRNIDKSIISYRYIVLFLWILSTCITDSYIYTPYLLLVFLQRNHRQSTCLRRWVKCVGWVIELLTIKIVTYETRFYSYQWFGASLEVGTAVGWTKVGRERSASGSQKKGNGQVLYHIGSLRHLACLTKFYK